MPKQIGDCAKEFRLWKQWNFSQMGKAVGTSHQNIIQLETIPERVPKYIKRLAEVMGSTVDDLMNGRYTVPTDETQQPRSDLQSRLRLPVAPEVRARTLLAHLWRQHDAAGVSMGRSPEAQLLEAVLSLLGDPNPVDMERLDRDSGALVNETMDYLSARRAVQLGLK